MWWAGSSAVVDVTRACVVLRHGNARYTLPLGGLKPAAEKPPTPAQPIGAFVPGAPAPASVPSRESQASPEQQALPGVVGSLGGTPQGVADSALNQAQTLQSLIGKQ